MKKTIALFVGLFGLVAAVASQAQSVDVNKYCPAASELKIQPLAGPAYYTFVADKLQNHFASQKLTATLKSGQYVYLKPLSLNAGLSHYVAVSNTLTCMYDMMNSNGYVIHTSLYGHNFKPSSRV